MWELDYKERSAWKNWSFWTVVLKKTLASPLDCKEIHPVHPKGNQSWIFIGRTDDEAEAIILWPPDAKNWLIGKDPDAGRDWGQEEKGTTEDEMAGWHHWLDRRESDWTLGVSDAFQPSHPRFPLLLLPSNFFIIRVFSNVSVVQISWPSIGSFSFSISRSNEYSGLISFRMDWLDLRAVLF